MSSNRNISILMAICIISTAGCSAQPATEEPATDQQASAASLFPPGMPTVTGEVVETMDVASYTYIRVDTGSEEIWAAANQFQVAVGDRVTVPLEAPMENFHSDTLDRDFPIIYFASFIAGESGQVQPTMPSGHPPVTGAAPASEQIANQAVEAADGGLTVAELWHGKADLADTTVTVRGRVVKFNGGIMGTNWLHLQDGSGSAADGTNDITVTTQETAAVGDIVTATGTLVLDQDFGAGYIYAVMVKDATVEAK